MPNTGKITQIIGAVLDIKFTEGTSSADLRSYPYHPQERRKLLVVEVAQHLGDETVRCIAMGPTDGLVRGMEAVATGAPISVPVGEETLGRIFNVTGDPIDNKPAPAGRKRRCRSIGKHRHLRSSPPRQRFWRPESRSLICSARIRRVERSVCSEEQE